MTNNKRAIILTIVFSTLLMATLVSATFAFFNYTRTGGSNTLSTGLIDFSFTDDTLMDLSNEFPQDVDMTNQEEVSMKSTHTGSLNISGHNTLTDGVRYSIYVVHGDDISGKQRLADSSIKFQLTPNFTSGSNGFTVLSNDYATPTNLVFDNEGKALISTGLVKDTTQLTTVSYNFYMWIDSGTTHISSTTKRATLAEGNPSLADTTSGTTTAGRYMKNDGVLTTETLYPARSSEAGKIIYTTDEFSNGYYNIKFMVVAEEAVAGPVCKRVTDSSDLHTEECTQTGTFCYGDGYYADGNMHTNIITYGKAKEMGSPLATGDAFDCDVDGTGYNKRFYYVSPKWNPGTDVTSQSFDTDTAILIYYSNTYNGETSYDGAAYSTQSDIQAAYPEETITSYNNWHGPVTAIKHLPLTSSWNKVSLNSTTRAIMACNNENCSSPRTSTSGGNTPQNFSYEGYAGRLLTIPEIKKAGCDSLSGKSGLATSGALKACNFLLERTKYASNSMTTVGIWVENPNSTSPIYMWVVYPAGTKIDTYVYANGSGYYGIRPVIEVPISKIMK